MTERKTDELGKLVMQIFNLCGEINGDPQGGSEADSAAGAEKDSAESAENAACSGAAAEPLPFVAASCSPRALSAAELQDGMVRQLREAVRGALQEAVQPSAEFREAIASLLREEVQKSVREAVQPLTESKSKADQQLLQTVQDAVRETDRPLSGEIDGLRNLLSQPDENIIDIKKTLADVQKTLADDLNVDKNTQKTLNEHKNRLQKEADELRQSLQGKDKELKGLIAEKKSIEKQNAALQAECEAERLKYGELSELLPVKEALAGLNGKNRDYLRQLCGGEGYLAWMSLGRDKNRIKQLWEYLKTLAVKANPDSGQIGILNEYFEFCLKVFNSAQPPHEQYVRRDIAVGSGFDLNLCIRTEDSRQIGSIKQVLTACFMQGNSVIYKAVVKVI